jgi:hypothetical protein
MKNGITVAMWELESMVRGAKFKFDDIEFQFSPLKDWGEFYAN